MDTQDRSGTPPHTCTTPDCIRKTDGPFCYACEARTHRAIQAWREQGARNVYRARRTPRTIIDDLRAADLL